MASRGGKGRVRVELDEARLRRRFEGNFDRAQVALDTQVLRDSTPYVPMDQGELTNSGERATEPGSGKVIWDKVYAWAQYNRLPNKSRDTHPLASVRWFEVAKAIKKKSWLALAKRIGGGNK